jgi:hypothetical protein
MNSVDVGPCYMAPSSKVDTLTYSICHGCTVSESIHGVPAKRIWQVMVLFRRKLQQMPTDAKWLTIIGSEAMPVLHGLGRTWQRP